MEKDLSMVTWCEELTAGVECEWEADPDTKPPRCKDHMKKKRALKSVSEESPKCPDTTVDGFPCKSKVNPKRTDGRCTPHGRMADGHKAGNPNPKCKGCRRGVPCTMYAIKGEDFCKHHIHPDPAVRRQLAAEHDAKRETGNDRFAALLAGKLAVEELTDEELLRGYPLPSDGQRSGRPPSKIPMAIHKRCVQELFHRADEKLKESLLDAIGVMQDIMHDNQPDSIVSPADKMKAATWIYERVRGKIPEVVQHVQEKPFETIMTKVEATRRVRSERVSGTAALESYVDAEEVTDE